MSETAIVAAEPQLSAEILSAALVTGDISRMSEDQRLEWTLGICRALGVQPALRPIQWIKTREGKVIPYATKACTDQLAQNHKVRLEVLDERTEQGLRLVRVRATAADGRSTEELGAVPIEGLRGDNLANAMMKAITKAKRRAILSLCGAGMIDEIELETMGRVIDVNAAPLTQADLKARIGPVTPEPPRKPQDRAEPRVAPEPSKPSNAQPEPPQDDGAGWWPGGGVFDPDDREPLHLRHGVFPSESWAQLKDEAPFEKGFLAGMTCGHIIQGSPGGLRQKGLEFVVGWLDEKRADPTFRWPPGRLSAGLRRVVIGDYLLALMRRRHEVEAAQAASAVDDPQTWEH